MFEPGYERSDEHVVGVWRIDGWGLSSPQANIKLKEVKVTLGSAPLDVFEISEYPNAANDVVGESIPIGFGIVKGAKAFLIDSTTQRFKIVNHSVISFQAFYDGDNNNITPAVIDLANGEFTFPAWDESASLFADFTAEGENPVDCVKLLLTDSVKGANIPLTDLDTTSTGNKGFGTNGARNEYIYGTNINTGAEVVEFPIGLYVNDSADVTQWIQRVAAASFAVVYVDITGLYQIKSWKPQVFDALDIITDENIQGVPSTNIIASDVITKVVSKYSQNHGQSEFQTFSFSDDRLRQLRGLTQHSSLEEELPLSSRFGARYWAQRTVAMRGVPRRILTLKVTQEMMLKEPGDYVKVESIRHSINEVWEVFKITINPGSKDVTLGLIDVRGFREKEGFWAADANSFPASLGGAVITRWSSTWTDEQKLWAKQNLGFWCDDDDYIDKINDPQATYRGSVWV